MQNDDHDFDYPNAPWKLWQLLDAGITGEDWQAAIYHALFTIEDLPAMNAGRDLTSLVDSILTERQFGPEHFRLTPARRLYFDLIRPLVPTSVRPVLRRFFLSRQRERALLGWPIEDRYVRFQVEMLRHLLNRRQRTSFPYLTLWPQGRQYAFVLTHDIESREGQEHVREIAALEETYGFRSSFNFTPEEYPVDRALMRELEERGFEIGVRGLRNEGKLFRSRSTFKARARKINGYLHDWKAAGFRAPFTHRHPEWMQALQAEYDSTFFDTDPFETIPGGTMSIWPFLMGRLVELPITLTQDHTLLLMLGQNSPRLWLDKIDFIRHHSGMAMTVTHPDHLHNPDFFSVYESFLRVMSTRTGYWHALPRDVARWWRRRGELPGIGMGVEEALACLPDGTIGTITVGEQYTDDVLSTMLALRSSFLAESLQRGEQ